MPAHEPGERGLDRVQVGGALVAHGVSEPGIGLVRELESRHVGGVAEEGPGAAREAQALGVELALVLPDVRLVEAREAQAQVEKRRAGAGVDVVVGKGVVDPEEVVTGRAHSV